MKRDGSASGNDGWIFGRSLILSDGKLEFLEKGVVEASVTEKILQEVVVKEAGPYCVQWVRRGCKGLE